MIDREKEYRKKHKKFYKDKFSDGFSKHKKYKNKNLGVFRNENHKGKFAKGTR